MKKRPNTISLSFVAFLLFSFSGLQAAAPINAQENATSLEVKIPVKRDFRSGAVHSYKIKASAGTFIEVAAIQNGVDISLAASAPDGRKIIETNAPTFWFGRETLVFAAEEAGDYRIEIKSARPGNFAGNYEIALETARALQPSDRHRIEANRIMANAASQLQGRKAAARTLQAIEQLKTSLTQFSEAGDMNGEAAALLWIGLFNNRLGARREAAAALEKSIAKWRSIGDRAGEAAALTEAGIVFHYLNENEKGLYYLNQALALRQNLLDRLGESATLTYLCQYYNNTGAFQKGLETCRRSVALRQDGDVVGGILTLKVIGNLHYNLGEYEKALFYFEQAVASFPAAGDFLNPETEAAIYTNIGGTRYEYKDYKSALEYIGKALRIGEEVGNRPFQAGRLRDIGEVYFQLGNYEKSLENLFRSLKIYEELNLPVQQAVHATMGRVYGETGQTERARASFEQALQLNRMNGDRYAAAETLYSYAFLENKAGQFAAAGRHVAEGIKYFEFVRADILSKQLRTAFVTQNLRKFYELQTEIFLNLNDLNPGGEFALLALKAQERSRARTLLEVISETGVDVRGETNADLLRRERILLDEIGSHDEKLWRSNLPPDEATRKAIEKEIRRLNDEYEGLQEEMRRANPAYAALSEPKIPDIKEIQEQILDGETALVEYALGERGSAVWIVTPDSVQVRRLKPKAQIDAAARKFYELLSQDSASVSPGSEKQIQAASANLQKMILAPLAGQLGKYKRLLIVADGALQYIPFAALPGSKTKTQSSKAEARNSQMENYLPLAADFEIVNVPSVSTLAALRQQVRQPASDLLAILADPVFDSDDERLRQFKLKSPSEKPAVQLSDDLTRTLSDFRKKSLPRLPFTGREANLIAGQLAPGDSLLATGLSANRQRVMAGELEKYKLLHFATHGFLNAENPALSGLVLSLVDEQGRPQNGFLRAQDVYTLQLRADLVVLSACQTALGKEVAGEGVISLTRGFMYAGAPRVVASFWKVDDAATAELMKRFYAAMLRDKKTPAAALREAQLGMMKIRRWQSPQYWAGFALQGDWR